MVIMIAIQTYVLMIVFKNDLSNGETLFCFNFELSSYFTKGTLTFGNEMMQVWYGIGEVPCCFCKTIHQILMSDRTQKHRFWSILDVSGL